jgi:hypothetical protein
MGPVGRLGRVRVKTRRVRVKVLSSIAAAVVLLALPSAGLAQTKLPVGEAHGVRIVREHGAMVVVFTHRAAKRYRRIAGRIVTVDCTRTDHEVRANTGGSHPITGESGGPVPVRAPKHGRKLVTGDQTRDWDYCRVWLPARTVRRHGTRERIPARLIVSVPLTQTGAVFLDEESKAFELAQLLISVSLVAERRHLLGWPTYELLLDWGLQKKQVVSLATPRDTPPAGAIGYYSDGQHHVAVATLSSSGRRLFIEFAGDVVSTNVAGYILTFRQPT